MTALLLSALQTSPSRALATLFSWNFPRRESSLKRMYASSILIPFLNYLLQEVAAIVESVKSVSNIYSPVSGEVTEVIFLFYDLFYDFYFSP
jgi:hypothetical protein